MYAILTHSFKIVCFAKEQLIQKDIKSIIDISEVAYIDKISDKYSITNSQKNMWFDFQTNKIDRAIPNGSLTLQNIDIDIYSIKYKSSYMRALSNNCIDFIVKECNGWECFRLLNMDQVKALLYFVSNKWFITGSNEIIQINTKASNFKTITFGNLTVDFNQILDSICEQHNTSCLDFIFHIDWKVYRAVLIKPAIVFVLFGYGKTLQELKISLTSLNTIGKYDGDIFIVTDICKQDLTPIIPKNFINNTHFIEMSGIDRLDYVGARISIFCSDILLPYQPILYSDADILFDNNINNFLPIAAIAKQCSAQIEYFNKFKTSNSTGASLFKQDKFEIDNVQGFNGGLLLVPNMKHHQQYLKAAYATIHSYTSQHGRNSIHYYDQSTLNYVLYKLQNFNPSPVSEHIQIGGSNANTFNQNQQKGFVHFWNSTKKHIDMENYLIKLQTKK